MKKIYSTFRPNIEQKSYIDWITKRNQKLSVSNRGLIAFTSSFCLNQCRPTASSYHLYVAEINTPYHPYLVFESENDFKIVEWDSFGSKLLVCDARGSVSIFTSKDYLASDWKPYFQYSFAAETFVTAAWYHPGIVGSINIPNQNLKSSSNHLKYSDKIQQSKYGASLLLFGGKAAEGCLMVSKTGLVCCLTMMADGSVDVACESLAPLRTQVEVADIAYREDGSFIVATTSGCINSIVSFYKVQLISKQMTIDEIDFLSHNENKRIMISSKQFNSFHLNVMSQIIDERENSTAFEKVAHVKFITKDSPEDVLVEIGGQNLSLIELWQLEPKKKATLHCAILDAKTIGDKKPQEEQLSDKQESSTPPIDARAKEWVFKGNYIAEKDLVVIQTPRSKLFGANRQLHIVLLAYKDSSICCLRTDDLQPIVDALDLSPCLNQSPKPVVNPNGRTETESSPYKFYPNRNNNNINNSKVSPKLSPERSPKQPDFITDIEFTNNQAAFVAIDSKSQLHVVSLPPLVPCNDNADHETYLQYLLEYCLITGGDCWDVLVSAGQESIESICDKLHDAYERQPKHIQTTYFNRQLMIRAALHRCLNSVPSLCKSSDCHTIILLNSISSTIKSLIRSQERESPDETLSDLIKNPENNPDYYNYDNVIAKLDEKDFLVETNVTQSLQPLCQWVTDLCIFLVASLPQRARSNTLLPGSGLIKSAETLESLKELLIVIKTWGNYNEACLPMVYQLNEKMDILATLFRLISMAHSSLSGSTYEDSFIDECVQFSNSISVPHFEFVLAPVGVASPLLQGVQDQEESKALSLEFFREPSMPELVSLPKIEGSVNMCGTRRMDVIRNISLGTHPVGNVRRCTRCRSVSLLKPSGFGPRIWELRWVNGCVCGGSWVQSDPNFATNKVACLAWLHFASTVTPHSHAHQLVR